MGETFDQLCGSVKYCPSCGADTTVINTRENQNGTIRRRRECLICGQRFTTREVFAGVDKRKRREVDGNGDV